MNVFKGKGKGFKGFGKGGMQKGLEKGFGSKGFGKTGMPKGYGKVGGGVPPPPMPYENGKGKGKGQIFYGNCHHCGNPGHSQARCPMLGKGSQGHCHNCGIIGHTANQCPFGPKGKGKGVNALGEEETAGIDLGGNRGGENNEQENDGGNREQQPPGPPEMNYNDAAPEGWQNGHQYFNPEFFGHGYENMYLLEEAPREEWKVVMKKGKTITEIHTVAREEKEEYEWVQEKAIVDSGTVDTVCGPQHIGKGAIRETEASKRGANWTAAGGGKVKNLGEGDVSGKSAEGIPVSYTTQVGDKISKMLISVSRTGDAGNMTIFNADINSIRELAKRTSIDENFLYNKKAKLTSKINREGGLFTYPIWIRKKKEDARKNEKIPFHRQA